MCSICGVISFQPNTPLDRSILLRMNASLRHRGPDDEGYYEDDQASLAMWRLSIIDLHTGQQPISNESGNIWVVYHGEIYNFEQVRATLEQRGHIFKTQTDTEVIVHAYEEYGDKCVTHFNGMFAFALWDARERRLFLARDRLGIKLLYYWPGVDNLVRASEFKALTLHPDVPRQAALQKHGYFDHQIVTGWIQAHLEGHANHSHRLWAFMVFQLWHQSAQRVEYAIEFAERAGRR